MLVLDVQDGHRVLALAVESEISFASSFLLK